MQITRGMSLNHELSALFETMSKVMELKGESVFKAIAFGKVARALRDVSIDIKKCCDEGTLKEIEGLTPAMLVARFGMEAAAQQLLVAAVNAAAVAQDHFSDLRAAGKFVQQSRLITHGRPPFRRFRYAP